MSVSASPSTARSRRWHQRKRIVLTVALVSVGVHIVAAIVAGIVIVARYLTEPPAEFKVMKVGCVLNFVGFEMKPEDQRQIGAIVRATSGKIREIK